MSDFSITSNELIDYTLKLQKINDVSLPFAVQNALNEVAKDVKKRTLAETTNKMFNVKRKNFFKSNSAFKMYKPKQFGYKISKMHADVGITKGKNPNETATEQVVHQQTAKPIKRGINPLGNKPQTKNIINILSKKPEFVEAYGTNNSAFHYIRAASRAKRRSTALVITNSKGTGSVHQVKSFRKRKPTKRNPQKSIIKLKNIASYNKGGHVKLKKKAPFLNNAAILSTKEKLNDEFIKAAEKQISKFWKK